MIDKEAIRAAAEAATPGPWRPEIGDDYADVTLQDGQPLADCHYIDKRCFDTARYIARMDPATTLALLDELEAKRCACKWEGDDATVCELCMAHRFVVEAQVSPYRTDLATATEALREIGRPPPWEEPGFSKSTYDRDRAAGWYAAQKIARAALAKISGATETMTPCAHPRTVDTAGGTRCLDCGEIPNPTEEV